MGQLYGGEGLKRPFLTKNREEEEEEKKKKHKPEERHVFIINDVESDCSVIWLSLLLHMQLEARQPVAG